MKRITLVFLACVLSSFSLQGKTLEVKQPAPIQRFLDAAEKGDVIVIPPGYYEEALVINKPLTLKAKEPGRVIIGKYRQLEGPFTGESGIYSVDFSEKIYSIYQDNGRYRFIHPSFLEVSDVEKVKQKGGSFYYDEKEKKLYFSHEDKTLDPNRHSFAVSLLPSGIMIRDTENVSVEGFRLEYCGIKVLKSKNVVIKNNVVGRVNSAGINVYSSKDITIENCALFDSACGFDISDFENVSICHCTVYRTRAHGMIANKGKNLSVSNSIFYAGGVSGDIFYIFPEVDGFKSNYNNLISYDYPPRGFKVYYKGTMYGEIDQYRKASGNDNNSISADPQFLSEVYLKENLNIRDVSLCKGKGSDGKDLGIINFAENWWVRKEETKIEKKSPAILFLGGSVSTEKPGHPNKYALRTIMPDEVLQNNLKKWGYSWTIDFFSTHLTLDYLKQFNLVVLLGFPIPARHPEINETEIRQVENLLLEYVKEGGGLLLTGVTEYGMWAFEKDTEEMNLLLKPLDIFIYKEQVWEKNPLLLKKSNISYVFDLAYTDNIIPHAVTKEVKGLLYPISNSTMAYYTRPLKIGDNWVPLIKGSRTACSVVYDLGTPDVSKRMKPNPGSVNSEPVIAAIRQYGKGKICVWPTAPTATIIDPYHKFWGNGAIMKPLDQNFPSYGETLISNLFSYLSSTPGELGGYAGEGPVMEEEKEAGLYAIDWDKTSISADFREYPGRFKGIVGLKSHLSDGKSSPEEMIKAAKEAGYQFAVFAESLERLAPEKLERLNRICAQYSDGQFQAFPGYTYYDASGNRYLVFGRNLTWPQENWWYDREKKIIRRNNDVFRGYGLGPVVLLHPDKNPEPAMFQGNFKGIAVYTYQNNVLIDEATAIYTYLQSNGFELFPLSVNLVDSPEEIRKSVSGAVVYSYVPWFNLQDIIGSFAHLMKYQGKIIYQRPHFISSGPLIDGFQVVNFGSSDLAIQGNDRFRMFISVSSEKGLAEVKILDKENLWRRFILSGEKQWSITMDGFHDKNHNFLLLVKDIEGKVAISSVRSTFTQEVALVRCSDNLNTYTSGKFKAVPVFPVRGIENYIDRQAEAFSYFLEIPGWKETIRPAVEQILAFVSRFGFIKKDILNYYYPETAYPNWNVTDIPELAQPQDKFNRQTTLTLFTPWSDGTVIYLVEGKLDILKNLSLKSGEIPVYSGNWVKEASTYVVSYKDGKYFTETIKPWSIRSLQGSLQEAFYVANIGAEGGSRAIIPLTENLHYTGLNSESMTHSLRLSLKLGQTELNQGERIEYRYLLLYTPPQAPASNNFVEEIVNKMGGKGKTEYSVIPSCGKVKDTKFILKIEAENNGFAGKISACRLPVQLPVFIEGLNERWPAGIWYKGRNRLFLPVWKMDKVHNRYSIRQEFVFQDPVFRFGILNKTGMLQVDTEIGDKEVYMGNLLVCDHPDVFLELEEINCQKVKIFANNPGDREITVTIKPPAGFNLIGEFAKKVTLAPGGFARIEIDR